MSLILCRQEPVTSPYFVEELGVHLYSSQELNYVIYHHPLLVMEDFVNERLAAFLRTELRLPFLAERIQKWIQSRGPSDELLFLILQDCAFYTQAEQAAYRQKVAGLRKLSSHEYEKKRADYFYSLGLYGRSASMYKRILDNGEGRSLSHEFRGKVWNNLGACYGELFSFQKAMEAYVCAWNEKPEAAYLKGMYFLTKLDPELSMKDRCRELLASQDTEGWDREFNEALARAGQTGPAVRLQEIFDRDPEKRLEGAAKVLNQWKLEYRKML